MQNENNTIFGNRVHLAHNCTLAFFCETKTTFPTCSYCCKLPNSMEIIFSIVMYLCSNSYVLLFKETF